MIVLVAALLRRRRVLIFQESAGAGGRQRERGLGLKLGHRIHLGLSQQQMRRVIGGMLVLTGGSLLVRVLVA